MDEKRGHNVNNSRINFLFSIGNTLKNKMLDPMSGCKYLLVQGETELRKKKKKKLTAK